MDASIWHALVLATIAGASIPAGAVLALWRPGFLSGWIETETRHSVMAFGAGALLAAVALVLIPEGAERLSPVPALFFFVLGGLGFGMVDRMIARSGGKLAQFLAMMMDYVPEALALGAIITGDFATAILVAALICLQNLPEGFNAMREMQEAAPKPPLPLFFAMVPVGPVAACIGFLLPAELSPVVGAVMMLSAGGILYLMFQDIAPQVPLENSELPPISAILGFGLGLAGDLLI